MDYHNKINPYALYIHCDAAMDYDSKNSGGIGIRIEFPDFVNLEPIEKQFGKYVGANIERLELEAIIKGLNEALNLFEAYPEELNNIKIIIITTDRHKLCDQERTNPYTIKSWRSNNWCNNNGKKIKNYDLLEKIDKARKKLSDRSYCRVHIDYQRRKFRKKVDKLAKGAKDISLVNDSIAKKGLKIGWRIFDGPEINYNSLKENEEYLVRIFKKDDVGNYQWEINCEIFDGEFVGRTMKIYSDNELERQIHRQHIYKVKLQKVYKYYVLIYNTIEEVLIDGKRDSET
ncbi:MAG: hypothetical protein IPM14_05170 [bacterium]|nr:hypothetical protein [bacterium]